MAQFLNEIEQVCIERNKEFLILLSLTSFIFYQTCIKIDYINHWKMNACQNSERNPMSMYWAKSKRNYASFIIFSYQNFNDYTVQWNDNALCSFEQNRGEFLCLLWLSIVKFLSWYNINENAWQNFEQNRANIYWEKSRRNVVKFSISNRQTWD